MKPAPSRTRALALTFALGLGGGLGLLPDPATAQACALKLSQLEAETEAYRKATEEMSEALERGYDRLAALERKMADAPFTCPAELTESRTAALALEGDELAARSELILDCGHHFNQRVLRDIERARIDGDSQMVLRLGAVQQRIFAIEEVGVEAVKQATFLAMRAERLVAEHDTLTRRCTLLGDAYD